MAKAKKQRGAIATRVGVLLLSGIAAVLLAGGGATATRRSRSA